MTIHIALNIDRPWKFCQHFDISQVKVFVEIYCTLPNHQSIALQST